MTELYDTGQRACQEIDSLYLLVVIHNGRLYEAVASCIQRHSKQFQRQPDNQHYLRALSVFIHMTDVDVSANAP